MDDLTTKMTLAGVSVAYGSKVAVGPVDMLVHANAVTALIGPSGCGKSSLLRCLNRMNELVPGCAVRGSIALDGQDIYAAGIDAAAVRRRIGMVFQRSNPFAMSVFDNVAYGLRIGGLRNRGELGDRVQQALRRAALWDEVKDNLGGSGLGLSGGQQQRLCIARCLALEPEVLLMDEPCSALDPIATARIEELLHELRASFTIVIVTHNMQQAARVAEWTGFFYQGELVEFGPTERLFTKPAVARTEDYITGRFG